MTRDFTKEFLDEIRDAVPLREIVGRSVELKRKGRNLVGLCPFHSERTGSFTVFPDGGFKCFGCGEAGDVIGFTMRHDELSFPDAVKFLAGEAGIGPEVERDEAKARETRARREERERRERADRQRKADAAAKSVAGIVAKCSQRPHPYLADKGFPEEPVLCSARDWLVIPVWNAAGEIRSAQYISADSAKKFHPGGEISGNFHRIGRNREIFLCEGYATGLSIRDALRRRSCRAEVRVCFSASNMVKVGLAAMATSATVYTVADHDKSGTGEASARQIGAPYWMPEKQGQDANDVHAELGIDALADLLRVFRFGTIRGVER